MIRSSPGLRLRLRCLKRRLQPASHDSGFVLLLAFFGALVLLLSSLSLQTVALQTRRSEGGFGERRQREDALFSAAQLVVGRLQAHRCLLTLSLKTWAEAADHECSRASDRKTLLEGTLPAPDADRGRYVLLGYEPDYHPLPVDPVSGQPGAVLEGADLTLEWRASSGGRVQRSFRLLLEPAADALQPPLLRRIQP